jgi:hypothetical protein
MDFAESFVFKGLNAISYCRFSDDPLFRPSLMPAKAGMQPRTAEIGILRWAE